MGPAEQLGFELKFSLGADAIALIPKAAAWASLSKLSLARIKLDSPCSQSIVLLHDQLQGLNLAFTHVDTAGMSQLASQAWPRLLVLVPKRNRLTADAVASLALAAIPNLEDLNLAHNNLSTNAARHLSRSAWIKLCHLSLHDNMFDDTAMAFLAKGHWPNLRCVTLYGKVDGRSVARVESPDFG